MGRERMLAGRTRRSSNRAPGFDYRSVGAYFLTIVTYGRECIFGEVILGTMRLSHAGELVADEWARTPEKRRNVELDEFVVMPNHFHGIIRITTELPRLERHDEPERPLRSPSNSVGAVVRGFKGATTAAINQRADTPGLPLWQPNYHDRVLRSPGDLEAARQYIRRNPSGWPDDVNYAAPSNDPRAHLWRQAEAVVQRRGLVGAYCNTPPTGARHLAFVRSISLAAGQPRPPDAPRPLGARGRGRGRRGRGVLQYAPTSPCETPLPRPPPLLPIPCQPPYNRRHDHHPRPHR